MTTKILTFIVTVLLFPIVVFCQNSDVHIYAENNEIKYKDGNKKEITDFDFAKSITLYGNKDDIGKDGRGTPVYKDCKDFNEGDLILEYSCKENKITISIKGAGKKEIWFCDKESAWKFTTKKTEYNKCQKGEENKTKAKTYKDITEIEVPEFQVYSKDTIFDKQNRFLLIDANPNPNYSSSVRLVKRLKIKGGSGNDENSDSQNKKEKIGFQDKEAKAVSTRGNLSVFLKNYNITGINKIIVTINEKDYNYNTDLSELLKAKKEPEVLEQEPTKDSLFAAKSSDELLEKRTRYLKQAYKKLNVNHLNFNDILRLEKYKNTLKKVREDTDLDITFDEEGSMLYSKILSFSPLWVGLTPIAPAIQDTDEIEVKTSIEYPDQPKSEVIVGRYKTIGGLTVDIGGNFFLTGLRNNKVYTDSITVGETKELRAKIGNKNQTSLGYGLNAEVSFRTGALVRPTINIGSFIPFEEDISPYFAFGPGISLVSEKVKIRFASGIAYGKINAINEQYKDRDLSIFENLTNDSLTEKIWDSSWFISIGIRYVFNKERK